MEKRQPTYDVTFTSDVLHEMCRLTLLGCARRYKQERVGFLFGRVEKKRHIIVDRATLYRGGTRTRSGARIKVVEMVVRRLEVGRQLGRRSLGIFHSHISSGGEPAHGVSPHDRRLFRVDVFALVAVIVAVRPAIEAPRRGSKRTLIGYESNLGCTFNIRAYSITEPRLRMLPVRAR